MHQVLEKITRIDQKDQKFIVSCYHMNYCLQKNTLHINLHILYIIYFKTNLNIQK